MAIPTTILGALVAAFDGNASLRSQTTDGLWVGQVPENHSLPLVALIHNGAVPMWTFEREYVETVSLSFYVYAVGLAAAELMAIQVMQLYDWQTFVFQDAKPNATWVKTERTLYKVDVEETRAPSGDLVFRVQIDYTAQAKRTY